MSKICDYQGPIRENGKRKLLSRRRYLKLLKGHGIAYFREVKYEIETLSPNAFIVETSATIKQLKDV